MLVQVPEYPVVFEETDEAAEVEPDTSHYEEDGSLEVLELLSINNCNLIIYTVSVLS